MKKYFLFLVALCLISPNHVNAQLGGLLKKATKSVSNEILGTSEDSPKNSEPEPDCASDQAELAFDLGGKLHLLYTEINIKVNDEGALLVKDQRGGGLYIANNGVTQGPYKEGDPKLAGFDSPGDNYEENDELMAKYKQYITKSGDKYLITFGGKSYGPYAIISNFIVSKAKTKFAAFATKNAINEDEGKKLEEALKNAKTQQEQIEIAQKIAARMQEDRMAEGSNEITGPELVTNIPDSHFDIIETGSGKLTADIKYDDILIDANERIIDLHGKTILNLDHETYGSTSIFINSDNTKSATYKFGTLTFNDKKTLSGMTNPNLIKVNGQLYLSYLYYSPKRNAIMQNKIAF